MRVCLRPMCGPLSQRFAADDLRSAATYREHLRSLLEAFAAQSEPTIVASIYAGIHGIPAMFPRSVYPKLHALHGDKGARALLAKPPCAIVAVPCSGGEIDIDLPEDLRIWRSNSALDRGFDVAMRFVDGHKDVVGIVLPKGAEIGQQMMQVRHGECDAGNFRCGVKSGFSHIEERVLHAHAVVRGKFLQQRGEMRRRTAV